MEQIPIDRILPNPEQPRKAFDPEVLEELAESIREHDVIQPVVVEAAPDGGANDSAIGVYILHDGERRLQAAKLAGLAKIPAVVCPSSNGSASRERFLRALVANLQRDDLNPIEEACAFARLVYLARDTGAIRNVGLTRNWEMGRRIEEKVGRLVWAVRSEDNCSKSLSFFFPKDSIFREFS